MPEPFRKLRMVKLVTSHLNWGEIRWNVKNVREGITRFFDLSLHIQEALFAVNVTSYERYRNAHKANTYTEISAPTCGESAVGMHGRDKGMQYLRERVQISDFHLTNETNSNHLYHCADTRTANPPSRSRWSGAALTQPAGRSINRPCARAPFAAFYSPLGMCFQSGGAK